MTTICTAIDRSGTRPHSLRQAVPVACLIGLLGGIALSPAAARAESGATSMVESPRAAATPPEGGERIYSARGGESLWQVAAAHGVPFWTLLNRSELSLAAVRALPAGARVALPGSGPVATLAKEDELLARQRRRAAELSTDEAGVVMLGLGETAWDVAQRYGIKLGALMQANELADGDLPGLTFETPLQLPGVPQSEVQQPGARTPPGHLAKLTGGQSIWDVARADGVGISELLAANRLPWGEATRLRAGARLFVPVARSREADDSPRRRAARARARRLELGRRRVAGRVYRGRSRERWARAAGPVSLLDGTLLWPVRAGHFVRGYGSGPGDYHLAVDIGADPGAKVRAAAPGLVVYADNDLSGYGKLVLIAHPGGFNTMYAHNSTMHVRPGELVARGDVVAEVGSTGLSRGPHLHFELLYHGKNCNPERLFRPGIRHGPEAEVRPQQEPTTWVPDGSSTRAIRCADRRHPPDNDGE